MNVIRETIERYGNQTVEDYLSLPEGTIAQLIDGELIMSPAPGYAHQKIIWILGPALERFVRERNLGEVLGAPFDVHLSEEEVYQPDILFLSSDRRGAMEADGLHDVPDLIVEVLSPSTGYYDLTKKRDAYEPFGVKEYWIVDPERKRVEILVLEEGVYGTNQVLTGEGRARSVLLEGFEIEVAPMFELAVRRSNSG